MRRMGVRGGGGLVEVGWTARAPAPSLGDSRVQVRLGKAEARLQGEGRWRGGAGRHAREVCMAPGGKLHGSSAAAGLMTVMITVTGQVMNKGKPACAADALQAAAAKFTVLLLGCCGRWKGQHDG